MNLSNINQNKIAKDCGCSPALVSYVLSGDRKTTNLSLAFAISKITGKAPIEFVSGNKDFLRLALGAHPELDLVPGKKSSRRVHAKRITKINR